jgi:hypothetical protein
MQSNSFRLFGVAYLVAYIVYLVRGTKALLTFTELIFLAN